MIPLTRYDDIGEARPLIERCIRAYGWAAEHNTANFYHSQDPASRGTFFVSAEGWGVLAHLDEGAWYLFGEPVAPHNVRGALLYAVCAQALGDPAVQKVVLEVRSETRRALLNELMPTTLRSRRIAETFCWPVLDLAGHDLSYAGPRFKDLRNARSRLLRDHQVRVAPARRIPSEALHDLVRRWERNRRATHQSVSEAYHALIDDRFSGTIQPRVLLLDGKPESLGAGWRIPHSNTYYLAVSLHSYAHKSVGEAAMMMDIDWAKREGYDAMDLGGSDKKLLAFKKQFGKVSLYKTHQFSIVRR